MEDIPSDALDKILSVATEGRIAMILSLPFRLAKPTPSAQRVKSRAKAVGSGIPDYIVPSAHREVEPSKELMAAAKPLYSQLRKARVHLQRGDGDAIKIVDGAEAADVAAKENRRLLKLRI